MAELWRELADARAQATAADQPAAELQAALADVEDRLGVLAGELADLPGLIDEAQSSRDRAAAALPDLVAAQEAAQAAAERASAARQEAESAVRTREDEHRRMALELARFKALQPRRLSEEQIRRLVAAREVEFATAARALDEARKKQASSAADDEQARKQASAADTAAREMQAAHDEAQERHSRLQTLLDQARSDHPQLLARADEIRAESGRAAQAAADAWARVDALLDPWLAEAEQARQALRDASRAAVAARLEADRAQRRRRAATRSGDDDAVRAAADDVAAVDVAAADAAAARARAELDEVRARVLGDPDDASLVACVRADVPLLLLPVRIETAFMDTPDERPGLAVRVYPDAVGVDGNVAELTDDERELGAAAVAEIATGDDERARAAWARLAATVGAGRAAWLLHALNGPDPGGRPDGWRPPPVVRLLPDRWLVLGYAGGRRSLLVSGAPIPVDLPVLDAMGGPDGIDGARRRWATDFDAAIAAGMAVHVPLTDEQLTSLDALVVVGVGPSLASEAGSARLAELLHAHRCTGGLALPPTGAATNVSGVRANGSAAAPGRPDAGLLLGPPAAGGSDGERAARALGLAPSGGPLDHVTGAGGSGQALAARASAVLWPATWGYFLDHMLTGLLSDAAREQVREHAVSHVRGAGTLPLIQVARQPYGLWPVTSLTRFAPAAGDALGRQLAALLRGLRERVWQPAAAGVPRLDPAALAGDESTDPSGPLAAILGQRGRAFAVRGRTLFGGAYARNLSSLLAGAPVDPEAWERRRSAAAGLAILLELPQAGRVADAAFAAEAADLTLPTVGGAQAEVAFLLGHGWRDLRAGTGAPPTASVLALLLRHAALRSYVDAAATLLGIASEERAEPELVAVHGPQDTAWDLLERTLPDSRTAGDALDRRRADPTGGEAGLAEFDAVWAGLAALAHVEDAAWEGLLGDVLDTSSHRLDAWVTSLADRGLARLRDGRPTGVAVGGYGWVTDLAPTPYRRLRAEVGACVSLRDLAATAVEDARRKTAAAVSARTTADESLAAAQTDLKDLEDAVAMLEKRLERLQDSLDQGRGPRVPPEVLQRRITPITTALEADRDALPGAKDRVTAARDALARAQEAEEQALRWESIPDAELMKADANLAETRRQLGQARAGTEEFLHAPSLQQASTAAVLRSGYLAHRTDAGPGHAPFSIDLSSARARQAAHLAEGVRAGQPPAALLGYQFERNLRDRGLAALILPLRTLSPYGEVTAAEVNAAQLRLAADRSATALQELRDLHTRAVEAEASTGAKRRSAEAALEAARREEREAREALVPAIAAMGKPGELELVRTVNRATDAARALAAAELAFALAPGEPAAAKLVTELQDKVEAAEASDKEAQQLAADADARTETLRASLRNQAVEAAAASSVVDGLAVLQRYRRGRDGGVWDASTLPLGGGELPDASSPDGEQLLAAFAELSAAVDAVSDAAVAEAVHQLVQGNAARAGAAADAVSHFDAPPALEVVRTPRSGSAFTHRLAVVVDPVDASAPADGWPAGASPRAAGEPALERWLRRRLPHPGRVRAAVEWVDEDGVVSATGEATLAELGVAALDVVYGTGGDHGELTDRLLDHVDRSRPDGLSPAALPRLVRTRPERWGADVVAWPELLAVAGALRELLAAARHCDGCDLAPSGEGAAGVDVAELTARADGAVEALERSRALLAATLADPAGAHGALLAAAALGVPGAVPLPAAQGHWPDQVGPAAAELARRAASLADADGAHAGGEVAHQLARLSIVLGEGFRVLPVVRAQNPDELAVGAASTSELTGSDPGAPWTWLARAARVRAGVARLSDALLLADAVCGHEESTALDVLQLPHGAHPRWLALREARPAGGELSLVLARDGAVDLAGRLAGFVVDEWSETVPDAETMTGVALRSARPRARAPQSMLLAVAPTAQHIWDLDSLEALLLETLELARLRAVDLEALNAAGSPITQYLPAAYLATNAEGATVSTDLPAAAAAS